MALKEQYPSLLDHTSGKIAHAMTKGFTPEQHRTFVRGIHDLRTMSKYGGAITTSLIALSSLLSASGGDTKRAIIAAVTSAGVGGGSFLVHRLARGIESSASHNK